MAPPVPRNVGPVVLSVAGDQFIQPAQLAAIVWTGTTTPGDRIELIDGIVVNGVLQGTGNLLWACSTDAQYTYMGISFAAGCSAPNGFRLKIATPSTAGRVMVYLRES